MSRYAQCVYTRLHRVKEMGSVHPWVIWSPCENRTAWSLPEALGSAVRLRTGVANARERSVAGCTFDSRGSNRFAVTTSSVRLRTGCASMEELEDVNLSSGYGMGSLRWNSGHFTQINRLDLCEPKKFFFR